MSKLTCYDFRCRNCEAVFEDLIDPSEWSTKCPKCGELARRIISPVRIDKTRLALSDGASPGSINHFDRVHRQRRTIEERNFRNHGDYGKPAGCD